MGLLFLGGGCIIVEKRTVKDMNAFKHFLETSYTAYHATENAAAYLQSKGFLPLREGDPWSLKKGGKYYVTRNGSSIAAFTVGDSKKFKIVASHTDSPCLKLKENPVIEGGFAKLNTEPYGGGLWYTFFDRPLKLAGRTVCELDGALVQKTFVSDFNVVVPSLAIHMNREANERFSPDPQTDLSPVLSLGKTEFAKLLGEPVAYDLYAVCAEPPFESGTHGEFLSSPRIDNLTGVYSSLRSLAGGEYDGICLAVCLDNEEIGSRTRQGAGGDFLRAVLVRIAQAAGMREIDYLRALSTSFLISLDNAHSLHPNHPEKCDPTNRAVMGGGVVIKGHAGGAYTTDALSSAVVKTVFNRAGVRYQTFFNRSDMRSGSTLGAISLGQVSLPSVDIGLAQLAMHSAVETLAKEDYDQLEKGLSAFYRSDVTIDGERATIA